MSQDIFISYSHKDYKDGKGNLIPGNIISTLKAFLDKRGYSYWIDENGIDSGDVFTKSITDNILDSKVVLFVSTENSNKATWTAREIAFASVNGKKIIPFRYDNSPFDNQVQFFLATVDFIDYRSNPQKAMEKLERSLSDSLGERISQKTSSKSDKHAVPFIEEFAGYKFEPTSVTKQLRHSKLRILGWTLLLVGAILIMGLGFCGFSWKHPVPKTEGDYFWYYNPVFRSKYYMLTGYCSKNYAKSKGKDYKKMALYFYRLDYEYLAAIMLLLLCIDASAYVLVYKRSSHKRDIKKLRQDADYIQDFKLKNGDYVFIAKDRKFGVYDTRHYKVVIVPQYDQLSWERPNIMWAFLGNERFLIDILNNRLG